MPAPQKAAAPEQPSAAHLLELRLRAEIAGQSFANKVKIQATGNAFTLSGSMNIAEHRELLREINPVPSGVRVIDDVDLTENAKDSPASATAGWIWVRSSPPGARIIVDGAETGLRTPARVELPSGQHDVRVVRRGFGTAQRSVQVTAGETIQFTETLGTE